MAILKCKMCGGDLEVQEGVSICECEFCGTKQTVPNVDDEKKIKAFTRANRLRAACDFDKAIGVYETIVSDFPEEAEAYWGLLLCKFGIEYVDDPKTGKKIPTCHRSSFDSIMDAPDFEMVMEYSDPISRAVYREEAKAIEELRIGINEVSSKEEPYDIFICYKETDASGDRTIDSVIAQDVYDALVEKGYRVFFSRISLEDKLGVEYEPYIFAALNSAKIMLAFGTSYDFYNSVWVKNEWSRYLKLMAKDKTRHLIPCFKNVDVYDIPKEFAKLQSQDMGKIGAVQDLLRGIEKILPKNTSQISIPQVSITATDNNSPLLKRGFMFLEDKKWGEAGELFEQVLNQDPENAQAYLGMLMIEYKARNKKDLGNCKKSFVDSYNYGKILRFGDKKLVIELKQYINKINTRSKDEIYNSAVEEMNKAKTEKELLAVAVRFKSLFGWKNANDLYEQCLKKAHNQRDSITKEAEKVIYAIRSEEECKEKSLEQQIIEAKDKLKCITDIIENYDSIKLQLATIESQKQEIFQQKEKLLQQRSTLSLLAIKEKRQIDVTLRNLEDKLLQASNHEIELENHFGGYSTKHQAEQARYECELVIDELETKEADETRYSYKQAISLLLQNMQVLEKVYQIDRQLITKHFSQKMAKRFAASEENAEVIRFDGTIAALDDSYGDDWTNLVSIEAYSDHVVGLKSDGMVVAAGRNNYGQCDVGDWTDIIAIAISLLRTVGLKLDGTVVSCGYNKCGQCNTIQWTDIISIDASNEYTIGLKSDGTVVIAGADGIYNRKGISVSDWEDIVAVSVSDWHVLGLMSNGRVVAAGRNDYGQCNVDDWNDIIAIKAGNDKSIGLKSDGTVVAVGDNKIGQCNVGDWTDIIAIDSGVEFVFGLKSDGTVVISGKIGGYRCDTSEWRDVVAVKAWAYNILGIRLDGTIYAKGDHFKNMTSRINMLQR